MKTMTETRKIDFETKDYHRVEMDLDDFVWLITKLYYLCNAVGCMPSMQTIEDADNVLKTIYENNLNTYIE